VIVSDLAKYSMRAEFLVFTPMLKNKHCNPVDVNKFIAVLP